MQTGIAPTMIKNPIQDWTYYYDSNNHIVYLKAYRGNDDVVVIYDRYYIDGCLYKTALSSNNLRPQEINDPEIIYMFKNARCRKIIIGDQVDVSKCVIMKDMFRNCINLEEIDFGKGFDTKNVADMSNMFRSCRNLQKLDLSHFDTSSVLDMSCMFMHCDSLTDLFVTNFDTSRVGDMNWMFANCASLKNLNLTSFTFDTERVYDLLTRCTSMDTVYFRMSEMKKLEALPSNTVHSWMGDMAYCWKSDDGMIAELHLRP